MDPVDTITPSKDTSFALMLAAQELGHRIVYLPKSGLSINNGTAFGQMYDIRVRDTDKDFAQVSNLRNESLTSLDFIIIRADPPFDQEYLHETQILERAHQAGTRVINNPQALRDCNEKLFATEFPSLMPKTLVSASHSEIVEFHATNIDVILKPLDGMGGSGIFHITKDGINLGAILEALSPNESHLIMAQEYRPEISEGDRRVLVIHGKPIKHVLARFPKHGETRGNLAAGGRGLAMPISIREREIAERIGPSLLQRGLLLVGLDIIGGYLTEINITSPTCIREIDSQTGTSIGKQFFETLCSE